MSQHFNFNLLFIDSGAKNFKEFVTKTGLGKNTPTLWSQLQSDENIRLGSVLKIKKAYPCLDLKKHFPSYNLLSTKIN